MGCIKTISLFHCGCVAWESDAAERLMLTPCLLRRIAGSCKDAACRARRLRKAFLAASISTHTYLVSLQVLQSSRLVFSSSLCVVSSISYIT